MTQASPADPEQTSRATAVPRPRRPLVLRGPALLAWGAVAVFLMLIAAAGGFPALFGWAAALGIGTALYALVTGRQSWALIPSRGAAAVVLVASLLAGVAGAGMGVAVEATDSAAAVRGDVVRAPDEQTAVTGQDDAAPGPTFDEEAPAGPATVEVTAVAASVAVESPIPEDTTALALLETLPVKGRAPKTGYDREEVFGTAWLDVDRNGCDTRNDILARDLDRPEVATGGCTVMSGTGKSPYTGEKMRFVRGNDTSALVQIDHLVSLSNAWQTGAQQLTQAQRISLANDPINLIAVDQRSNAQKGDGDTATWLPANKNFRCPYVARQVSVKATYGLWVTESELAAMRRVLTTCADKKAFISPFSPAAAETAALVADPAPAPAPAAPAPASAPAAPAPAPVPAPAAPAPAPPAPAPPAPAPASGAAYFANCTAARAAGAAPVHAGDPGYGRHLDRDGDGVGCE